MSSLALGPGQKEAGYGGDGRTSAA